MQKQDRELHKQHAELQEQATVNERQADQNRKLATRLAELKVTRNIRELPSSSGSWRLSERWRRRPATANWLARLQ